jgi:predicted  nucleic acid-binding Zn-ribbon protein
MARHIPAVRVRQTISDRLGDLESYVSDTGAHLADLETRLEEIRARVSKGFGKRIGDLESGLSDVKAHVADIDTRIERIRKRMRLR